jgi:hypothetical protein
MIGVTQTSEVSETSDVFSPASLPFAKQVKVFSGGLAMWQQNVKNFDWKKHQM